MYNMYEVEKPIYQDYVDIQRQYDENLIVMTNVNWGEHGHLIGGIVRYYGDDKKKLMKIWSDLTHSDEYGECLYDVLYANVDYSYLRNTGRII